MSGEIHKVVQKVQSGWNNFIRTAGDRCDPLGRLWIKQFRNPGIQESKNPGIQEFRNPGTQESRNLGLQQFRNSEFRNSGIQEFRSPGIQKSRNSVIQEFSNHHCSYRSVDWHLNLSWRVELVSCLLKMPGIQEFRNTFKILQCLIQNLSKLIKQASKMRSGGSSGTVPGPKSIPRGSRRLPDDDCDFHFEIKIHQKSIKNATNF